MKETTRIHIAKISYDIEITAKKDLERYIHVLETYASDQDLLNDIEIRITELLAERHVAAGGVITTKDVSAVREKLGEPEAFIDNSEPVFQTSTRIRKLYRNIDTGIAGGVLSGVGSFFDISPFWIRLVFVLLSFLTAFAPIVLAYFILWLVLPPARTTAEKLQMAGKPVTLDQMRELNLSTDEVGHDTLAARRTFGVVFSIISTFFAISSLAVTIFGAIMLASGRGQSYFYAHVPIDYGQQWPYIICYYLIVFSGILLTTFFSITAYSFYVRRFSKRTAAAVIIIVIAGIVAFGSAVGLLIYRQKIMSQEPERVMNTETIKLPGNFKNVTSFKTTFNSADVQYIVDKNPRLTIKSLPGTVEPTVEVEGNQATLSFTGKDLGNYSKSYSRITVYGPKLSTIEADGTQIGYQGGSGNITIRGSYYAQVTVKDGEFQDVSVDLSSQSKVRLSDATVNSAKANVKDFSGVWLGVVRDLEVTLPESCSSRTPGMKAGVDVSGVTSGKIQYNGTTKSAADGTKIDEPCALLSINPINEYAAAG